MKINQLKFTIKKRDAEIRKLKKEITKITRHPNSTKILEVIRTSMRQFRIKGITKVKVTVIGDNINIEVHKHTGKHNETNQIK